MFLIKTPKATLNITATALSIFLCASLWAGDADTNGSVTWLDIEARGANQDVYFHAWGGDPQINRYIQWVADQVKQQYQITLHHVKLTDTSEAVSRVLAEKSANNDHNGQVDMVWINGDNFAAMAKHQLLTPLWAAKLPNFGLTDPDNNPAMTRDFGLPTQGMEAPWGKASLTFYYDSLVNHAPPQTLQQLSQWAQLHPGRFTYPKPPDFLGMSFLKYALIVLNHSQPEAVNNLLYQPATLQSQALLLPVLWQYLDNLHPNLWRKGQHFMSNGMALRRLMGDGELSLAFTFSAADVPAAVARFDLPDSIRSYRMQDGSLSNIHFVAIPYNAAHTDSAKLVVNFLLSAQAQAKKQQPSIWGDTSVIALSQLPTAQQAWFKAPTESHPSAQIANQASSPALSEPDPSWTKVIATQWLQRYGVM
ncbi:ABC transporter substrate-binding protein [Shewanella livingstonensis]|uniref:ABC transporter substrate-binding protein n=2 Tax=Shewanella livingstonensis TaxID=150120 RepID=A0A3G8M281_9GAMM|nr:ABC transporter substrate-binding protein [Shewanella livingstonensis]